MNIIKYLVSTVKLNGDGITSLLKISAVLNKKDIALYFFLNGGFIIDDTDPNNEFYYNVYPNKVDDKIYYVNSETNSNIPANNIIKLSDQKKLKEILDN